MGCISLLPLFASMPPMKARMGSIFEKCVDVGCLWVWIDGKKSAVGFFHHLFSSIEKTRVVETVGDRDALRRSGTPSAFYWGF